MISLSEKYLCDQDYPTVLQLDTEKGEIVREGKREREREREKEGKRERDLHM